MSEVDTVSRELDALREELRGIEWRLSRPDMFSAHSQKLRARFNEVLLAIHELEAA